MTHRTPLAIAAATFTLAAAPSVYGQGAPAPRAEPVAPRATPAAPAATPVSPDPGPAIAPAGGPLREDPEGALIQYANYVYSQRQWELAAGQYDQYLKRYPVGKDAAAAWYRLGESALKLDDPIRAENAYRNLFKTHRKSEYGAPAAYRLASIYYARGLYKQANPYFDVARSGSKKAAIRLAAAYYRARCLNELGMVKETLAAYEEVAAVETGNPYQEAALLTIARMRAEAGEQKAALDSFVKLAATTARPDIKGEALVKAGLISSALGDDTSAETYLTAALDLRGAEEWKPDAQFHLIKTYYARDEYAKVTDIYRKGAFAMSEQIRPKLLLMAGNSYRHLKQYRQAIDVYLILREHYPETKEASESEYRKLLCFYHMRNPSLPEFVDQYVTWQSVRNPAEKNIDMALLLKGEFLFNRGVFAPAGEAYDSIRIANIPEELRASTLYKRGWAHSEGGNHNLASRGFAAFIDGYPDDPRIPNALAKRALSYRAVEDYTSALRDLDQIISDHPDAPAAELAYQQSALIKGQQRDYAGMVDRYTKLLENYPESKAAPEAKFWIGWGQFELKNFAEASAALREARELDGKAYFDRATLRILLSEYTLQNVAAVRAEIEGLDKVDHDVAIPPQVYLWLGVRLFDAKDYSAASRFLALASTPSQPEATQPIVWKSLGQARLYNGEYEKALTAFDYYLSTRQPSSNRARVLHDKAAALLALGKLDEADTAIEEGLSLQPASRVYGKLCILWGEVAIQRGDFEAALKRLVKPTYAIQDEDITPIALTKSATAHEKLGQADKANELRARLKEKFPGYKPGGSVPGLPEKTAAVPAPE